MKNFFTLILDKLKAYLSDNTTESAMRLYGLMIILTSCLCAIGYTVFVCINITTINLTNAAAVYVALATFAGVGIIGKYYQKKVEDSVQTAQAAQIDQKTEELKTNYALHNPSTKEDEK